MAELQEVTATEKAEEKTVTLTMEELQKMVAEQVAMAVAIREGASEDRINTKTAEQFKEEQKDFRKMTYKYCDADHIDKLVNYVEAFNSKKYRERDWDNRTWKAVKAVGANNKGRACTIKGKLGRIEMTWAKVGSKMVIGFSGKPTFSFSEKLQNKGFRLTSDFTFVGERKNSVDVLELLPKNVTATYEIKVG